jgi:hypothetical protein
MRLMLATQLLLKKDCDFAIQLTLATDMTLPEFNIGSLKILA